MLYFRKTSSCHHNVSLSNSYDDRGAKLNKVIVSPGTDIQISMYLASGVDPTFPMAIIAGGAGYRMGIQDIERFKVSST